MMNITESGSEDFYRSQAIRGTQNELLREKELIVEKFLGDYIF